MASSLGTERDPVHSHLVTSLLFHSKWFGWLGQGSNSLPRIARGERYPSYSRPSKLFSCTPAHQDSRVLVRGNLADLVICAIISGNDARILAWVTWPGKEKCPEIATNAALAIWFYASLVIGYFLSHSYRESVRAKDKKTPAFMPKSG